MILCIQLSVYWSRLGGQKDAASAMSESLSRKTVLTGQVVTPSTQSASNPSSSADAASASQNLFHAVAKKRATLTQIASEISAEPSPHEPSKVMQKHNAVKLYEKQTRDLDSTQMTLLDMLGPSFLTRQGTIGREYVFPTFRL